ncbi:SPRY domain-containing SOCS box protein 1 [Phytophthora cinnamomi]|uniref:SPRY domain-containing SOCS box protein 1 n=1 Tax=Phytophthora cinnamomi TaxID=4785 RepID=UPI00355A3EC0|nr:SPRY domain-containing SOCS box protein 1 [Phytophthora cinnamomi]
MSRGRGRGRVRFGGSRDSMLADIMDETREDLGLSHTQMELLHAETGGSLYPPMELPQPEALADKEAYLIQRQRILAHKLESLYHPWEADPAGPDAGRNASEPAAFVHVTVPETQKANEVYVPEELRANSLSGLRTPSGGGAANRGIMQPRAFENVFKSLEAQEKKIAADKAKAAEQEADDGDMDDAEEDLGDDMNDYTFDYYDSDAVSNEGDEEVFF